MLQNILLFGLVIGCVIAYFVYCYQLYKICNEYGVAHPILSFVPLLNKFVLVRVNDVFEDGQMYIPVIKKLMSRNLFATLNCILTFILFMTPLYVLGYVVYFVTSFVIWYDIESDFSHTSDFEIIFDAVFCSIGLHSYPAYILMKYSKQYENGELLSMSDEEKDAETGYVEDDPELFSDYDDREIEQDQEYEVYTDDDLDSENVQEILNEY